MEEAIGRDAGEEALENFRRMKKESKVLFPAQEGAETRAARQSANVRMGISAGQVGQMAAGRGAGPEEIVASAGLMEGARRRGSSLLAGTLDLPARLGRGLQSAADSYAPQAVASVIRGGGKFAEALRQAAMSGPAALATTHTYLYDNDPFYRAEYDQAEGGL